MHEEIETVSHDPEPTTTSVAQARPVSPEGAPDAGVVSEALKNVYDPELGINIVDLGLVYDVQVDDSGGVDVQYSLTTMGCPIGPLIEDQIRSLVEAIPGVVEVRPEFVLRPAWSPEMMSEEAKAALGIF
jgi:metal-sulfur cluster biosynthetic enzyme